MITASLASTARDPPISFAVPPSFFAHTQVPAGEYFASTTSRPPRLVSEPHVPPKLLIVFEKEPITKTFPLLSVATARPQSFPVPPNGFAHRYWPPLTGQPSVLVLAVVLMADALPALSTALTA